LGAEYGYTREDFIKMTTRQVSEIIEAMSYRKSGKEKISVEVPKEMDDKIMKLAPKNFKER
jgi:hypothetical protein